MRCVFWRVAIKPLIKERLVMKRCVKITTQLLEQYGTEDEPLWKSKGSNTYVITDVGARANNAVAALLDSHAIGDIYREYPIEVTEITETQAGLYREPKGYMTYEDFDDPYCVDSVCTLAEFKETWTSAHATHVLNTMRD